MAGRSYKWAWTCKGKTITAAYFIICWCRDPGISQRRHGRCQERDAVPATHRMRVRRLLALLYMLTVQRPCCRGLSGWCYLGCRYRLPVRYQSQSEDAIDRTWRPIRKSGNQLESGGARPHGKPAGRRCATIDRLQVELASIEQHRNVAFCLFAVLRFPDRLFSAGETKTRNCPLT